MVAVGVLSSAFSGATSTAAPTSKPSPGRPGGVIKRLAPKFGAHALGPVGHVVDPTLQLVDHGGPVMTTENVYLIFWRAGGWSSFPSGYQAAITKWIQDVAADDGKTSNPFGAITQYGAGDNFHLAGVVNDSAAPDDPNSDPNSRCDLDPGDPPGSPCVNEQSLIDEIDSVRSAQGWPGGLASQFAILMPPGVYTCDATDACSDDVFCAYHAFYVDSPDTIYHFATPYIFLTLPYEPANACHTPDGSFIEPMPNGQPDVLIGSMSHEMREAATDPTAHQTSPASNAPWVGGWWDANGNESDDKCIDEYGSNIGIIGDVQFNQLINGAAYDTQTEWSNAVKGCYQVGPPTVTGFSPSAAASGSTVTVTGTNFFSAIGTHPTVKFNGIASAGVSVISPTELQATVPSGNIAGKISVTALGGTGTSSGSLGRAPTVTGQSATSGHAGDVVTLTGTALTGTTSVKFGGVVATFGSVAADGTSLKATVPVAAVDGDVTVTTAGGSASAPTSFTVLPTITSFTPASGAAGAQLTITGSGFGSLDGVTFSSAGDADGGPVSSSATQIVVTIPNNAVNGPITVHTHHGADNVTSTASFSPLPSVTSLDHSTVKPGDTVVVTGGNFTANGPVSVKVNGLTACSACSATSTTVSFTVPNTTTGAVTVTNANGDATSAPLHIVPRVDSVSGNAGAGSQVIIRGAGFGGVTSVAFGDGSESAAFVVGSGGTVITATVPSAATTGKIGVTNPDGTTLSPSTFVVAPEITTFAPTSATPGQTIDVNGGGLSGASEVDFAGGVSATPTNVTGSSLQVVVPAGAVTGPISVHTPSGTASSRRPLTITFTVAGFAPASADYGATVTVTGSGLTGATAVLFNGVPGTGLVVVDDGHVRVTVPASGSLTGPITVVKGAVSVRALRLFSLFGIHNATPTAGPAGTTVVITGVGLSRVVRVRFTGADATSFSVDSDTQITVVVPPGAQNGTLTLVVAGASASITWDVT